MTGRNPDITVGECPNGLRVVHVAAEGVAEYCGVTACVGSRDELTPARYGLAHFVEHTIFKGTPRRTDTYVQNRMEAVGGELNAFTTKEETTVYAAMPAGNWRRATALVAELVTESSFPRHRIDREREVICDEIDSYLDTPSEAVYDRFDELAFAGNPLAHNILGTTESVAEIDSDMCRDFLTRHFTASNMVYFYLGPESADKVLREVEKRFATLPAGSGMPQRIAPEPLPDLAELQGENGHQSHTVMGASIGGLHAPDRYATSMAVNILGGPGMNALLNVALRERRGLVYTVEASTTRYSDCGLMTIYFGCDHHDLNRCLRLTADTMRRLADRPLTDRQLDAYKRQFTGQMTLGSDNKEQRAIGVARSVLHGLPVLTREESAERVRAVTPEQLRCAAEVIASAPLHRLTLC